MMLGLFTQLGWGEVLVVLAVVLLLFGARRLPGLARALRRSGRELRRGYRQGSSDTDDDD